MEKTKIPLISIFIIVFLDSVGIRIVFPVTASIVAEVNKVSVNEAVIYGGWMMMSYAIAQFIFSPLLGSLSDVHGRKPILLLSCLGLCCDYFFLAFANSFSLFIIGRIIAGIFGASLTTAFAYASDLSAKERRAQNFGLISSAIGLGFIVGPFLGGLCSEYGNRLPFIVAAAIALFNSLFCFFILPESLTIENRRRFDLKRANPFITFNYIKNKKQVSALIFVIFFLFVSVQVMPAIWPFYTKYICNWNDLEIGYSLTFMGLLMVIIKSTMIAWTQKKIGSVGSVYLGLFFSLIGLCLFAVAFKPWMLYTIILVYCLGGVASPSLQAIISEKIGEDEQGELQGVFSSLMSISFIISPLIMTNLFYFFTTNKSGIIFPGAPFALAACFTAAGLFVYLKEIKRIAI